VLHLSLTRHCMMCNGRDVRRSRRWGFREHWVFPLLMLRPFRCDNCNARFLGLKFAERAKGHGHGEQAFAASASVQTPEPQKCVDANASSLC